MLLWWHCAINNKVTKRLIWPQTPSLIASAFVDDRIGTSVQDFTQLCLWPSLIRLRGILSAIPLVCRGPQPRALARRANTCRLLPGVTSSSLQPHLPAGTVGQRWLRKHMSPTETINTLCSDWDTSKHYWQEPFTSKTAVHNHSAGSNSYHTIAILE